MRVDPWGRVLASPERPELYLTADESESGIDLAQLRESLKLSPDQRLRKMAQSSRSMARVRGGVWPKHVPKPASWPGEGNRRMPLDRPFP
jgi:hypothetical protein